MARLLSKHGESHALLHSFLVDQSLVAAGSVQCGELGEVSSGLRQAMQRAERDGHAWWLWKRYDRIAAVSASLDEASCRVHGRPVLIVAMHDAAGRVVGASSWLETQPGTWVPLPP